MRPGRRLGLAPNQAEYPGVGCFDPVTAAGDYICFSQGPVFGPSPTGEPPFDAYSVVKDFKTPRAHNFSLSVQQEIARNNVLTIGYSGQRGQRLAVNRDLNASPLGSGGDISDRPFFNQFPDLRHIVQTTNLGDLAIRQPADLLQPARLARPGHGIQLHVEQVLRRKLLQPRRHGRLSATAKSAEYPGQPRPLRPRCAAEFQCQRGVFPCLRFLIWANGWARDGNSARSSPPSADAPSVSCWAEALIPRVKACQAVRSGRPGTARRSNTTREIPTVTWWSITRGSWAEFDPCGRVTLDDSQANPVTRRPSSLLFSFPAMVRWAVPGAIN